MDNSNKYRVTQVTDSGERKVSLMSESELQKLRAKRLQNKFVKTKTSIVTYQVDQG